MPGSDTNKYSHGQRGKTVSRLHNYYCLRSSAIALPPLGPCILTHTNQLIWHDEFHGCALDRQHDPRARWPFS